jgi:hypothetical protein
MSAYTISNPMRTTGATAFAIVPADIYEPEEGIMSEISVSSGLSAPNSFDVTIQNTIPGHSTDVLDYNLTGTYFEVS